MFLVIFIPKNGDVLFKKENFGTWFSGVRKNLTTLHNIQINCQIGSPILKLFVPKFQTLRKSNKLKVIFILYCQYTIIPCTDVFHSGSSCLFDRKDYLFNTCCFHKRRENFSTFSRLFRHFWDFFDVFFNTSIARTDFSTTSVWIHHHEMRIDHDHPPAGLSVQVGLGAVVPLKVLHNPQLGDHLFQLYACPDDLLKK